MLRLALLSTLLAACYEPDAVDCTVECAAAGDCADGQVCGPDHFCAAPDVAGMCNVSDEPQMVSLVVTITGHGKVSIDKVGNCDSESPSQGNCTFTVTPGVMQQLKAVENSEREFISWTETCSGSSATCALTPVMALTQVGAKFE
jgi:hypothetical protein